MLQTVSSSNGARPCFLSLTHDRYNYFDFDPDARSFICPLCRDVCNCSNCIRKRNLAHLLDTEGKRAKSLRFQLRKEGKGTLTVQEWLEEASLETRRAPFDRVRIVTKDQDIVSPDLPPEPEPEPVVVKETASKKRKLQTSPKRSTSPKKKAKSKKAKPSTSVPPETSAGPTILKFTVPAALLKKAAPVQREKEVDSDGETMDGGSTASEDNNDPIDPSGRSRSRSDSLTPLSSRAMSPPQPPRLAFPPRPPNPPDVNEAPLHPAMPDGYIHPALMTLKHPAPNNRGLSGQHRPTPQDLLRWSESSRDKSVFKKATSSSGTPSARLGDGAALAHGHEQYPRPPYDSSPANFIPLTQGRNGSAMADPPPYSHSPPRRLMPSPPGRRMNNDLLPPAPMAYSLAHHLYMQPEDRHDDGL